MALRRNKFSVGDYVTVVDPTNENESVPHRIITSIFLETDDTYEYMVDTVGWRREKYLALLKTHLQMLQSRCTTSGSIT